MTTATAAGLPRRPVPAVRRAQVPQAVGHFTSSDLVRVVELDLAAGEVTRLVVHWKSGVRTTLIITEDAG